jgi:hypothetical protein
MFENRGRFSKTLARGELAIMVFDKIRKVPQNGILLSNFETQTKKIQTGKRIGIRFTRIKVLHCTKKNFAHNPGSEDSECRNYLSHCSDPHWSLCGFGSSNYYSVHRAHCSVYLTLQDKLDGKKTKIEKKN